MFLVRSHYGIGDLCRCDNALRFRYGFSFTTRRSPLPSWRVISTGVCLCSKRGAHVRVDIFYRGFSEVKKAWVDLMGNIIFLQPVCWAILFYSWGYVEFSWRIMEVSPEPDGLPFVYLQKSLLIALAVLLGIQSLSEIFKSLIKIRYG